MNMHNSPAFSDLHYYKAKAPAMHGKAKEKTSIRRLRFQTIDKPKSMVFFCKKVTNQKESEGRMSK